MEVPEGYDYWQEPVKIALSISEKPSDKRDDLIASKIFYNTL